MVIEHAGSVARGLSSLALELVLYSRLERVWKRVRRSEREREAQWRWEGRVLGIGRGYPLEDQETGILSNDYTGAHTPLVHILYADELPLPPHNRHERPERTREDKRRIIG